MKDGYKELTEQTFKEMKDFLLKEQDKVFVTEHIDKERGLHIFKIPSPLGDIYTGPEGAKMFDEAMKKEIEKYLKNNK